MEQLKNTNVFNVVENGKKCMTFGINRGNNMKINIKDKQHSRWYKNCKRQRKVKAKICQYCPFRKEIVFQEFGESFRKKDK